MSALKSQRNRQGLAPRARSTALFNTLALVAILAGAFIFGFGPILRAGASSTPKAAVDLDQSKPRVPNFDINLTQRIRLQPSAVQLQALNALKTNLHDTSITARWDKSSGSVDTIYDFASAASTLDPEAAARNFIASNAALFGITDMSTLALDSNVAALGGNLMYFKQTYNGLTVANSGIGVVMDGQRRVKMVSGPYRANLAINTVPSLDGAASVAVAQADLNRFKVQWANGVSEVLTPALDLIASQLGVLAEPHPELNIFPTPDGGRLAYKFLFFSRNPFGVYRYQIDAATGQILYREDTVRYQQALPMEGDVYPTYPALTTELKDQGIISVGTNGIPLGQLRIKLRNFDASNVVTGVNGTLTGAHVHIENVLAAKVPFPQAAKGTWYFRNNDPANLEQRTYEHEQYGPNAEPAEHQDEINQFYYINSLIEYIDYLHIADDAAHHRGVGQGDFPDTYPNQSVPLTGNVHIPNVLNPPTDPTDPAFADKLLGLDNAFSLPETETVAGQKITVNPTSYGHGYLYNDLALDFGVPYHEGMHSISTPIAGLEGSPEGGALNEGQADLWAYSAAENPALGAYVVNGYVRRNQIRAAGGDPDLRQYIRNANTGLTFSQLGTSGGSSFEVHRDGEIYGGTMWDIRELMSMYETGGNWKRPDPITGQPTTPISLGKETWERIFLGSIYVLGTFSPDTFVRARDAMIIADSMLYASDPLDPDSPGIHRALIEQVYASREMGFNAEGVVGGQQVISTRVSAFTGSQGKPSAPAGVNVVPASPSSARVAWQPVAGAFAYEILKREIGRENQRQNPPVPGREYIDGDGGTDGYLHLEYVPASQTSYVDRGKIEGAFIARGLANPINSEYVVRALSINPNRQLGVSDNSAAASAASAVTDVTNRIQTTIANVAFANGKFDFDQTIKNLGAGTYDGTIYTPVEFRIVAVSNGVTVANADNGGKGTASDPASFYYHQLLQTGQTSSARHFSFSDPMAQLFTFDAVVKARVQVDPAFATRYQPEPGIDFSRYDVGQFSETLSGIVPVGDTGLAAASGLDYVDVPFTSKDGAYAVSGNLSSTLAVDLDLELLDSSGRVLSSSASDTPQETVTAAIQPNAQYIYRVIGWAGVASDFQIVSTQSLLVPKASGGSSSGGGSNLLPGTGTVTNLVRFTVNPITRTVTVQVLH
ncbi:MAG TPA: M36 family metallopeptidase [Blastocatellia bacterium]|nr:M36 family metallopeptidase [Blastocatellia bacterium]